MLRLITASLLVISPFTSLYSFEKLPAFEKTALFDKASLNSITLDSTDSEHELKVQAYSLKNISDKPIQGLYLNINNNRETLKRSLTQELTDKNCLWKWWKLNQSTPEKNGAYSSLINSTLHLPSREVPTYGESQREFFFNNQWHLIDSKQNLIYLALDNHTIAGYEDVADEPFIALRTKVTGLEESYNFAKACDNFAHFDIFPSKFDSFEPSEQESTVYWVDHPLDLYPQETIEYDPSGFVTQTVILANRSTQPGLMTIKSSFPIEEVLNQSASAVVLEDVNVILEPNQSYTFKESSFHLLINVNSCSGQLLLTGKTNLLSPWKIGENTIDLGINQKPVGALLKVNYELQRNKKIPPPRIVNATSDFDHIIPFFELDAQVIPEKIWWQISSDRNFEFLVPNFQGIQQFSNKIEMDSCTDTFFNPQEEYYFRVKSLQEGRWSDWSPIFAFSVNKPNQIKEPVFKKLHEDAYQISWEYSLEKGTQYYIFASNAFDFMPSIYTTHQYQWIDENEKQEDQVDNLIAITSENFIQIGTEYAFYRIIAEKEGKFSTPSPIIRVYDYGLSIPRHVLQASTLRPNRSERIAFPAAYPHLQITHRLESKSRALDLTELSKEYYAPHPYVDPEVFNYLKPFYLPENHPIKPKLDRLFSSRVTLTTETLKKAGFTQPTPQKFSHTIVSKNKHIPGYMFKLFADDQKGISDWQKCLFRVTGALHIQHALNRYNINHLFVVPTKWIYPLPGDPSPPANMERKNFIIVETALDIYTGKENNRMWKSSVINTVNLSWVYQLLSELGLSDSAYSFNMPITKDNRIAFIDTEHHHKWPVPFFKLWPFLSSDMKEYWNKMCEHGGPF